jgi:hypothetical protein
VTGPATCIVLDCRRTGKPDEPGRAFICAKHQNAAGAGVREHALARGKLRLPSRTGHWRFLERSAWERIEDAVAAKHELKPEAARSSTNTSGN